MLIVFNFLHLLLTHELRTDDWYRSLSCSYPSLSPPLHSYRAFGCCQGFLE